MKAILVMGALAAGLLAVRGSGAVAGPPSIEEDADGVVVPGPEMALARFAHTATTLSNGMVLIAGGFAENGSKDGAELFDPSQTRFVALPPMVTTRFSHSATMLDDGRVLIVGGYGEGGTTLGSAELFDPATRTFAPAGNLITPRADHVAVSLGGGKVLIVGGQGAGWNILSSAEVYDAVTGSFTRTGSMAVSRGGHVGVRLNNGTVLVVGGHLGRRSTLTVHSSAEVYDPVSGTFRATGEMAIRRHKHDAVLMNDGRVLVTGGSDERDDRGSYPSTEIYDPVAGTFTPGPGMQLARYKHGRSSMLLPGGKILVSGGADRAELYNPESRSFTIVPGRALMAGQFAAVSSITAGRVLITGGYGSSIKPTRSTWLYRP